MADGTPGSNDRDEWTLLVLQGRWREARRLAIAAECGAAEARQQASMYDNVARHLKQRASEEGAIVKTSEVKQDTEKAPDHHIRLEGLSRLAQVNFEERDARLLLAESKDGEATRQRAKMNELEKQIDRAKEV